MKKILTLFAIVICISNFAYANTVPTVFSQLASINTYWHQFNPIMVGLQTKHLFTSEQQKIQAHLLYVEKHLRSLPNQNLSATQLQNRKKCLDILHTYAMRGLFPQNTHHPGQRIPYFIDDVKTPCAVGHLIIQTGFNDLAQKINQENNYGYIKDLVNEYSDIKTWAKAYGFSVHELAWIQPCYGWPLVVTQPFVLTDSNVIRHPSCPGKLDGKIFIDSNNFALSPKPISATISFLQVVSTFTSAPLQYHANTYSITITDATNASTISVFTLINPTNAIVPTIFNTFNICNSFDTSGAINITNVTGGTAPYTYAIDIYNLCSVGDNLYGNYNYTSTNMFNGLQNNIYNVFIKDANGCNTTRQINLMDTSALASYKIISPNTCINATATVVTKIINIIPQFITFDTFYLASGNHLVTSSTGCVQSIIVPTKYWNATTNSNSNIACNGGSNNVVVGHTMSQFNFGTFTGIGNFSRPAGIHSFVVADTFGCADTATVVLTEPDVISNTVSTFPIMCHGDSTLLSYNTNGGTPPYSYNYNFGSLLPAGNYTVLTTDANGCNMSNTINITQPTIINNQTNYTPILCHGGTATINNITTGGTANYTYDYANGTALTAGIYTMQTTDANGCTKTNSIAIAEPSIGSTQATFDSIVCYGQGTMVTFNSIGATAPYNYNPASGSILVAGQYTIVATDNNGCTFTDTITIAQPDSIKTSNLVASQVSGGFSINFDTQGGTGAYTYVFQKEVNVGNYNTIGVTGALPYQVSLPGNYRVQITDANGCIGYLFFTVNFPAAINNASKSSINISPNPVISSIFINGIAFNNIGNHINIVDMQGRLIARHLITNASETINLEHLVSGLYVLKIGAEAFVMQKN